MIARPRAVGEDFNIGNPANTLTILQLAHQVIGLTGRTVPIQLTESPFPDIEIRVPSLSKAREILEYQPNYDLDRGLNSTIAWYREHLSFLNRASIKPRRVRKAFWLLPGQQVRPDMSRREISIELGQMRW